MGIGKDEKKNLKFGSKNIISNLEGIFHSLFEKADKLENWE